MKRKRGILTIIAVVLLIVNSCDLSQTKQKIEKEMVLTTEQISALVEVGEIHNRTLDFITNRLRKTDIQFKNKNELLVFMSKSAVKFVSSNYEVEKEKLQNVIMSSTAQYLKKNADDDYNISSQFWVYLNRIYSLKYNGDGKYKIGGNSKSEFKQKTIEIRNEAITNLNQKESILFVIAASTYINSTIYWNSKETIKKWLEIVKQKSSLQLSKTPFPRFPQYFFASYTINNANHNVGYLNYNAYQLSCLPCIWAEDTEKIVKADAHSAIESAIVTGALIKFFPAGWAAVAAGIGASAAVASAWSAITNYD